MMAQMVHVGIYKNLKRNFTWNQLGWFVLGLIDGVFLKYIHNLR